VANVPSVSVKGAATIAAFDAAHKGVLRDLPPHKLPGDALWDCLNVLYRNGSMIPRPGLLQLVATNLLDRVTGATQMSNLASGAFEPTAFENTAFLVTGNAPGTMLVAGTNTKLWAFFAGIWNNITNVPLTATATYLAQFTSIQIGSKLWIVFSNGIDAPQQWDQITPTTATIAGTPPLFTDMTTASDRVIGIIPPYTIQWGPGLSLSTWPALNNRILSDTPDALVAIENLGSLGVAVYKRRSIWVGNAQGGLDSAYFSFTLRGQFEGPANPNCLINVNGEHWYMTNTGRIAKFDGVTHTWINDGVLPLVRATFDTNNAGLAWIQYDPLNREVWCYYPRKLETNVGTDVTGIIMITLAHPYSYEGIFFPASFVGQSAFSVTAGTDRRLDKNDRILFGKVTNNLSYSSLNAENLNDDTLTFTGFWQTPPHPNKDGDIYLASGVETYATYGVSQGPLTMKLGMSPMMGDLTSTGFSAGTTLTMTGTEPTLSPDIGTSVIVGTGAAAPFAGRFASLRYSFTSPVTFSYYGSKIMGTKVQ
jgi:hypothetical protein